MLDVTTILIHTGIWSDCTVFIYPMAHVSRDVSDKHVAGLSCLEIVSGAVSAAAAATLKSTVFVNCSAVNIILIKMSKYWWEENLPSILYLL